MNGGWMCRFQIMRKYCFFPHTYCIALYRTILNYIILCCTVLHCTILYCAALYYTALYCAVLHCTALYYTILYYTILYHTILYCTVLYCTTSKYIYSPVNNTVSVIICWIDTPIRSCMWMRHILYTIGYLNMKY